MIAGTRLRANNPYITGYVESYEDGDLLYRFSLNHIPSIRDKFHIVQDMDRLDHLAFKYYKDSKYWWVLMDINQIHNPWELNPGTTLLIPDLDLIKTNI